jgi:hypothetical protein
MFKIASGICVFAFGALALSAQTPTPLAAQVTLTSGLVGIAEGQTAQLNALNPDVLAPATGAICTGLLSFVDGNGKVLKSAVVAVAPGSGAHIAIDSDKDLALAVNARREIRATILIPPVPPPSTSAATTPVCRLLGTLEIFNTLDGRTQVTLGTLHLVPGPMVTPGS